VRVLAALFALVAVALMSLAIVGMVTGRPSERAGWVVRVLALVCFAIAVVLNVLAH
jgi:VIT1/CCC1 family predicted Fe2+/Mn2+ transporter